MAHCTPKLGLMPSEFQPHGPHCTPNWLWCPPPYPPPPPPPPPPTGPHSTPPYCPPHCTPNWPSHLLYFTPKCPFMASTATPKMPLCTRKSPSPLP
ncbi:hypothetical protein DV515_00015633 [Chloebia gouldiae]|uniref:Uncharacterized protein n=1 Tax=Chloebia gouldiae TaxID=44316 RepID=A0A3L8RUW2_CHLGU|nr:hypothetical protein DV515_00015633 [Chloebia gouldiae]